MFLKTLTLKGFKSFADTTRLELEPGVTVVVGPNGSGKSNIVDAVAWVLGAQGPKTVRSGKMEDVIFAGTTKKPALGRAEVSLTIDNSAGLIPVDLAEVTITRTLFRSGDSEYAINGAPCRLLDVQELLSDSGVGRQQHVIVSQGQLSQVLDARPEDRRLIIEEAAGVLKYRRRKERAQRRLESTEGNLLRLQDLLREVRRQLRPLERQADAARRHGDLVDELKAIRMHLAGRELGGLQARSSALTRTRADLADAEGKVRHALAGLDADVLAAEARMSDQGAPGGDGMELGDALTRAEGLREKARGLNALLAERLRSVQRDLQSAVDHDVVSSLEAEAARLAGELAEVESEAAALVPQAERLATNEAALDDERATFEATWGDGVGPTAGETAAAESRGELVALRAAVDAGRAEVERLQSRLGVLDQRAARIAGESDTARAQVQAAEAEDEGLAAAAELATARRADAEAGRAAAEAALQAATAEVQSWSARAEALAMALDQARARAGAERLSDVAGVVGTLLDLVEVDDGWEAAFEAAAGEAIAAVVVDGVDAARQALTTLHEAGATGAVLALDAGAVPASLALSAAASGGEPVRAHVRSRLPAVEALLDRLLGDAVAVEGDWQQALDLALKHPGLIAVTRRGDRFAASGWRAGTGGHAATGAALDEARSRLSEAEQVVASATAAVEAARAALEQSTAAEAEAVAALDANDGRLAAGAEALARLEREAHDVVTESDAVRSHLDDLTTRLQREEARVAEIEALLPELEAEEAAGQERAVALRAARARLDERTAAVAALRTDLEVRAGALDERRTFLSRRLAETETRLQRMAEERVGAEARRIRLEQAATATGRLAAVVAGHLATVEAQVAELRTQRQRHSEAVRAAADRLDGLRRERAAAERQLTELRERAQRAELEEAEVRVRLEAIVDSIRREFDCEPHAVLGAECPPLPTATSAEERARVLERELRIMGPINPLALEEYTQLQERHEFLEAQLEDVKNSRRDLAKVIKAIDTEIVDVFSAAYADVSDNFTKLFSTLFPGGTGRLRLTDPSNLLETGIEVEARPSGKNVKRLSLLSGGERSLTALAYLFAVFRSRPSPFYLMDEVEAALDDVNLHRFLDLVNEFREEAQLLIVSHQKRTMEAADCLYGVTMAPGGSSRVLSEKVGAGA